jgi:hypothetical protein
MVVKEKNSGGFGKLNKGTLWRAVGRELSLAEAHVAVQGRD